MNEEREKYLTRTESVIRWFREHPDIPLPVAFTESFTIYSWDTKDEAAILAKAFGSCEKSGDENFFILSKRLDGATINAYFSRNAVCERIVVGTKEVETEEADPVAVAAIPKVKVKKQVEIVEWRCPELLGKKGPESDG